MDADTGSGCLPKFNGDLLVQSCIYSKIFMKIETVYPEICVKLWKNALSRNIEESFKKFLDPDLDDFQNLISSSLSTHVGYNFREDPFSSFYVKLLTGKQTDRQTPGIT